MFRIHLSAGPTCVRVLGALLLTAVLSIAVLAAPGRAAETAAADTPPPQVRQLLDLLDDPVVRGWVDRQRGDAVLPAAMPVQPAAAVPVQPAAAMPVQSAAPSSAGPEQGWLAGRLAALRHDLAAIAAAVPRLGDELRGAGQNLVFELEEQGLGTVLLLVAVFLVGGGGTELLFHWLTGSFRRHLMAMDLGTPRRRLIATGQRLAYGCGIVVSFALGSVGAFLVFDWPILLKEIVLAYLSAFLALRYAGVLGRFLLAPGSGAASAAARFRLIPMTTASARYWYLRLMLLVGWFAFGYATVPLMVTLGVSQTGARVVAYALGLVLVAMALDTLWRRPRPEPTAVKPGAVPADAVQADAERTDDGQTDDVRPEGPRPEGGRPPRRMAEALLSLYVVVLWMLWVANWMPSFWVAVVAVALPLTLRAARQAVAHLMRPPEETESGTAVAPLTSVFAVSLERGLRAGLFIAAALLLARAWGIDLVALTAADSLGTRLARGALNSVLIVLLADFAWHLAKALIDRKIAEVSGTIDPHSEDARRRARIRTLLPILRNLLFVVFVGMGGLMALAALGVEIGPLIAGAGVVGVAIGFGAQTLVKDVISGIFYLLDDAFRVGEYIQSGSYRGTVESFSLRSIKLRHHRGPLYTVPFGSLGAVQNMSRDWVIDKVTIGVDYGTNLELVKKLVKTVGKELAADPEFAPHILEPLKMQGVEQFGEFAIQIRMKIMTKPGEQFVIRRRAYALIKKAFEDNGIRFAFPTVRVTGEGEGAEAARPAAARQALEQVRAAAQPEPAAAP